MPTRITSSAQQGIYWNPGGTVFSRPNISIKSVNESLDLSEGHYGYPDFPPHRNVGGPLIIRKANTDYGVTPYLRWTRTSNPAGTVYDGIWKAAVTPFGINSVAPDGSGWSATAYERMKPAEPSMEGLNAIYELREIPHLLMQRFEKDNLKSVGDFHLAMQFGWLPLLSDTINFVQTQRNAQKRLKWLLEHNGKPVRRRLTLAETPPEPIITSGDAYGALAPTLATQFYSGTPHWEQRDVTIDKIWASARFRYWLPSGPRDVAWRRKMLRRIYGLRPTPKVVWNAIPWSWLVDWFSNVGDIVSNLDAGVADRLSADYMYVMREVERTRVYNVQAKLRKVTTGVNWVLYPVNLTSTSWQITRTRLRGSPFHPSLSQNNLSGMQLSILGALGLSRLY